MWSSGVHFWKLYLQSLCFDLQRGKAKELQAFHKSERSVYLKNVFSWSQTGKQEYSHPLQRWVKGIAMSQIYCWKWRNIDDFNSPQIVGVKDQAFQVYLGLDGDKIPKSYLYEWKQTFCSYLFYVLSYCLRLTWIYTCKCAVYVCVISKGIQKPFWSSGNSSPASSETFLCLLFTFMSLRWNWWNIMRNLLWHF